MPRTLRVALGGYCYHVLNRGNGRRTVFHKEGDFDAFVKLLRDADEHVPMRVLAFCLMPNHFHLVLWPRQDGQLSDYMAWLLTAHVRRYLQHYHSEWTRGQRRFHLPPPLGFAKMAPCHVLFVSHWAATATMCSTAAMAAARGFTSQAI